MTVVARKAYSWSNDVIKPWLMPLYVTSSTIWSNKTRETKLGDVTLGILFGLLFAFSVSFHVFLFWFSDLRFSLNREQKKQSPHQIWPWCHIVSHKNTDWLQRISGCYNHSEMFQILPKLCNVLLTAWRLNSFFWLRNHH